MIAKRSPLATPSSRRMPSPRRNTRSRCSVKAARNSPSIEITLSANWSAADSNDRWYTSSFTAVTVGASPTGASAAALPQRDVGSDVKGALDADRLEPAREGHDRPVRALRLRLEAGIHGTIPRFG